ncbi:MAG: hypothetical protein AAFS02_16705 [Pseudomonadota bacterium]
MPLAVERGTPPASTQLSPGVRHRVRSAAAALALLLCVAAHGMESWQLALIDAISPADWDPSPPPVVEIIADFDGNGVDDAVRVLSNADRTRHILVASLNSGTPSYQLIQFKLNMDGVGLRPVAAGTYDTVCGKGYGGNACKDEPRHAVQLTNPGFEIVFWEKASSIYYWDSLAATFRSFATSD